MIFRKRLFTTVLTATALSVGCSYHPYRPNSTAPTGVTMSPAATTTPTASASDAAFKPVKSYADFQRPVEQKLSATTTTAAAATTNRLGLFGELPGQSVTTSVDNSGNLRQVSFTREGSDFDADIDPTGRWLVYASTQHSTAADIYMKRVDGSTVTTLTSDPADDVMPAFSPDGQQIAFASNRNGSWDVYIKPIGGGQAIQITNDPSQELHPSWSPDGRQIVFSSLGRVSGQWEMVLVDLAQPARRRTLGQGLFPKFSPDGDKIVYQLASQRGSRRFSIWTLDLEDGEAMRPTEIAAALNAAVINPAWSPDGQQIAFATVVNNSEAGPNAKPKQADLWLINVDGTGRVKLTSDDYANFQPVWGGDGTIYFVSNRTDYDNIWAIRPNKRTMRVARGESVNAEGTQQATVPTRP